MTFCHAKRIKYIVCILTPLLLSPLAFSRYKEARCAFVILWMAVYWMLEPVHLTVTALLPVPLMPLLGILNAAEVAPNYIKEVLMMFIGGLGVAVAVEYCNLHERVALKVLLTLGADTKWLMFGFMFTAMFLSMWISNTATTAMMVPIIEAVMLELKREKQDLDPSEESTELHVLHKTLLLSVAYAANCGGTGTITGTSPNMVFKGYIEELYPESYEITYASWMAYNIPGMVLLVFIGWLILQVVYVPCWVKEDEDTKDKIRAVISSRYKELGRLTFHEASVLGLFLLLVSLWVFREPKFMPGWADVLASDKHVGDAVPAIGVLFLMFLLPADLSEPQKKPLLKWQVMQQKLPWGLVLLLGGGYALADGATKSGLSKWLGDQMGQLSFLPPSAVLVILCVSTAALTEVMSNSAVATILLPVINQMALTFGVNPLYLMLPVAIVSSHAFMLPVAAGPNAIVFDTGQVKTIDMIKPGILMNVAALLIQVLTIHTLGAYLFSLNTFPEWAKSSVFTNETLINVDNAFNSTISMSENRTVYL